MAQTVNRNRRVVTRSKCLSLRRPLKVLCYIVCVLACLAIIFVNFTKMTKTCFDWTPSVLCMANKHCAFLKKSNAFNSYLDLVPFMTRNQCVLRSEYKDYLMKGLEGTVDFVNSVADSIAAASKEIIMPGVSSSDQESPTPAGKKTEKLLTNVRYYYDEEIVIGLTRYEIGFWIIFVICYFLRKQLDTCGRHKTLFDYMRPAGTTGGSGPGSKPQYQKLTPDELRQLREKLLKQQQQQSSKESTSASNNSNQAEVKK